MSDTVTRSFKRADSVNDQDAKKHRSRAARRVRGILKDFALAAEAENTPASVADALRAFVSQFEEANDAS